MRAVTFGCQILFSWMHKSHISVFSLFGWQKDYVISAGDIMMRYDEALVKSKPSLSLSLFIRSSHRSLDDSYIVVLKYPNQFDLRSVSHHKNRLNCVWGASPVILFFLSLFLGVHSPICRDLQQSFWQNTIDEFVTCCAWYPGTIHNGKEHQRIKV